MATTTADFLESGLGFVDESGPEGTQANLDKRSVEKYLAVDIEGADCLLQMGHQHHIAGLVIIVVESQEVDLAKHSSSANNTLAIGEEVVAENIDESIGIRDLIPGSDGRVEGAWDRLPTVFFQNFYDYGWLVMTLALRL